MANKKIHIPLIGMHSPMHLMHHIKPVHNSSGFNTLLHAVGDRENVG